MTGRPRSLRVWLPAIRAGSGADVFTERLAESLAEGGHEPLLQWFDRRFELMPWILARAKAPPSIDLVHAGSWQGFAFKRDGIPLIITEHQYIAHPEFTNHRTPAQALYHRWFIERCVQRSYAVADELVTVSEYCAKAMRRVLRRPVAVIHNWIDIEDFSPRHGRGQGDRGLAKPKPFRLLFVGNPSLRKGADLLPEVARLIGPEIVIQCLGGLRSGFTSGHLPENMELLPSRPPNLMPELYRSVDAVIIPTRYEPFGYVAVEAMACGIPVVGFDSSGTAEVCKNGETALLVPVDDVQGLAACARRLADDPKLCEVLGHAGRQRATHLFCRAEGVSRYVGLYRSAIGARTQSVHGTKQLSDT